ncbi:hypothetical protein GBAR_LOCUS19769 [Geodia barretti]|uniref:ETS domain-containing protein n=1 Tax=Geodia barretti TaxID=519541 RepID=A0AA35SS25_GEOBA|nr:hypothetical protein GBAR_LOCUS19769 [Geodia barretti]
MSSGSGAGAEETPRSVGPEGSSAASAIAAMAASLGLPASSIEVLTNTLTANSGVSAGDVLPAISSMLGLDSSALETLAATAAQDTPPTSTTVSLPPGSQTAPPTSTSEASTSTSTSISNGKEHGPGGKDGNTGATAAALFPCLIYYPGSANNYSLMWVPIDGSSTAALNQASQAMAAGSGTGGMVWPGLGSPFSLPPHASSSSTSSSSSSTTSSTSGTASTSTTTTAPTIPGLPADIPASPSLTSALSGLMGQNYLQLLQALQQQQQQTQTQGGTTAVATSMEPTPHASPLVTSSSVLPSSPSPLLSLPTSSSLLSSPTVGSSLTVSTPQRQTTTPGAASSPQVEFSTGSQIQLWQFLLELLTDRESQTCIKWTNKSDWEFKITRPSRGRPALGRTQEQAHHELRETESRSPLLLRQEHHQESSQPALRLPVCL